MGYTAEDVRLQNTDFIPTSEAEAKFDAAVFDLAVFGPGTTTQVYGLDLYNARGKSICLMFRSHNADEPFIIRGYKVWFTYVPEFPA
jgi:hypothetical protein